MQTFIVKKIILWAVLTGAGFFLLVFTEKALHGAAAWFSGASELRKTYTVEFKNGSFSPKELNIQKGDMVEFIAPPDKEIWPASDLHPTHGIYPEFDPREPISPGKSWQFQFKKIGAWDYHDHLASLSTGRIIVGKSFAKDTCNTEEDSRCMGELVRKTIHSKGIDAAFDLLWDSRSPEGSFIEGCHELAHLIGKEAYNLFVEGKEMALDKSYYCGYGFYHGFAETMLQSAGTLDGAREFCAYADKQLAGKTAGASGACYHGIGHGVVDGSDPRSWGNAEGLIAPALKFCVEVGKVKDQLARCASGVFNALAIAYSQSKYGLSLKSVEQDPFFLCRKQTNTDIKRSCYHQMNTLLVSITKNFIDAAKYIEEIKEDEYAAFAMEGLSSWAVYSEHKNLDHLKNIASCRTFQKRLHIPCVAGFAIGIVEFGPPTIEYKEAVKFCQLPVLTSEEEGECFNKIIGYFRMIYSSQKVNEICAGMDERYRKYCFVQ